MQMNFCDDKIRCRPMPRSPRDHFTSIYRLRVQYRSPMNEVYWCINCTMLHPTAPNPKWWNKYCNIIHINGRLGQRRYLNVRSFRVTHYVILRVILYAFYKRNEENVNLLPFTFVKRTTNRTQCVMPNYLKWRSCNQPALSSDNRFYCVSFDWPRPSTGGLRLLQARHHAAQLTRRHRQHALTLRRSSAVVGPRRRFLCERPCAAACVRTSRTCLGRRTSPSSRWRSGRRRRRRRPPPTALSRDPDQSTSRKSLSPRNY